MASCIEFLLVRALPARGSGALNTGTDCGRVRSPDVPAWHQGVIRLRALAATGRSASALRYDDARASWRDPGRDAGKPREQALLHRCQRDGFRRCPGSEFRKSDDSQYAARSAAGPDAEPIGCQAGTAVVPDPNFPSSPAERVAKFTPQDGLHGTRVNARQSPPPPQPSPPRKAARTVSRRVEALGA